MNENDRDSLLRYFFTAGARPEEYHRFFNSTEDLVCEVLVYKITPEDYDYWQDALAGKTEILIQHESGDLKEITREDLARLEIRAEEIKALSELCPYEPYENDLEERMTQESWEDAQSEMHSESWEDEAGAEEYYTDEEECV